MTLRRLFATLLLIPGVALLGYAAPSSADQLSQALAHIVLAVGGLALCTIAIARRHWPVRPLVRNLACAVTVVFFAGLVFLWRHIDHALLPAVPPAAHDLYQALLGWRQAVLRLMPHVAYLAVAIAVLPSPLGRASRSVPESGPGVAAAGGASPIQPPPE